jgi:hypothetical protein
LNPSPFSMKGESFTEISKQRTFFSLMITRI